MVFPLRHAVTCACQDLTRRGHSEPAPVVGRLGARGCRSVVDGGRLARRANRCNRGFAARPQSTASPFIELELFHSLTRRICASSPTSPRRNSNTQTTKITPWTTNTH